MKQEKTYLLMYYLHGKGEQIAQGPASLMQFKKAQLSKEANFQKGRLTIISEFGAKYNYGYIK